MSISDNEKKKIRKKIMRLLKNKKYVPDILSPKEKADQIQSILEHRKRPKLKSPAGKKQSKWTKKAHKYFGDESGNTSVKNVSRTLSFKGFGDRQKLQKGLEEIVRKGEGAYKSSGSRPNTSAVQWGRARMFSVLFGGKARKIDHNIVSKYKIPLLST